MTARFAAALPAFAALLDVSPSVRVALREWGKEVDDEAIRPLLVRVARRIDIGAPLTTCLQPLEDSLGSDGRALRAALDVLARHGGPAGPAIEGLAGALAIRAAMNHQRRAAAAATRLSGRLMALLGAAVVVLLPAWSDGSVGVLVGSALTAAALMVAGVRWMKRLTPRPVVDDPVAALADITAGLIAGGLSLHAALGIAAAAMGGTDIYGHLAKTTARVELGAGWPQAMARTGHPDLGALGRVVERAQRLGTPVGVALAAFSSGLRERAQRDFEVRARRAAVMLVMPLTLCLLPGFAILIVVPLLRSLSA
jgi:Flp pilus assembly protein TadB